MITKIKNSLLTKVLSLVLAFNFMGFSSIYATEKVTLNSGTAIVLETLSVLKSDFLIPGQSIDFRVKYDVKADDKLVIPAGTIAKGQVYRVQGAKGLGKAGYVEVRISDLKAIDGSIIPLAGGNLYEEGQDKETEAMILGVLVCILFLIIKGENAEIPAGTQINAASAGTVYIGVE